jgi:hypothetical protein
LPGQSASEAQAWQVWPAAQIGSGLAHCELEVQPTQESVAGLQVSGEAQPPPARVHSAHWPTSGSVASVTQTPLAAQSAVPWQGRQILPVASQIGVAPEQSVESRQLTQTSLGGSHSGVGATQAAVSAGVHATQLPALDPVVSQIAVAPVQSESLQARQVLELASQTGLGDAQSPASWHATQVFVAGSQWAVAPVQAEELVAEHSTQAPAPIPDCRQAGAVPVGQACGDLLA